MLLIFYSKITGALKKILFSLIFILNSIQIVSNVFVNYTIFKLIIIYFADKLIAEGDKINVKGSY